MAQGKQQPKFERNPCIRIRYNCDTDGRYSTGLAISKHSPPPPPHAPPPTHTFNKGDVGSLCLALLRDVV